MKQHTCYEIVIDGDAMSQAFRDHWIGKPTRQDIEDVISVQMAELADGEDDADEEEAEFISTRIKDLEIAVQIVKAIGDIEPGEAAAYYAGLRVGHVQVGQFTAWIPA